MTALRIHAHTCLEHRGGAARVAALIRSGLEGPETLFTSSHEIRERDEGPEGILPGDLGRLAPPGAILHLHGTRDWPALLAGLQASRPDLSPPHDACPASPGDAPLVPPLVITAHDAALVTGGCPYPLDCQGFSKGCPAPCPRRFPDCARLRQERLALLTGLHPVLVSPSRWLARILRQALPDLPVRVIPNGTPWPGVDLPAPAASRQGLRQALGLDPGARAVLFTAHGGTEAAYKAGERWREYFADIKGLEPRAVGFLVGGTEAASEGDLTIWPYLPQERLFELMRAMDVLAYPTYADNHPLVVLEAMSAGLPVVSFALGGLPEQVVPGRTGLLVPPGDHAGLAQAVAWLLHNDSLRRNMAQDSLEHGRSRFSVRRMARDYRKLYASLA